MPTYEYDCPACPRVFELRQRISEPPLTTCDRCGGPVRRLLGPATFILKGGGWYVTDYPSEARKKAMQSESSPSPAASGDSKSSTGTGSAPPSSDGSSSGGKGDAGSKDSSKDSATGGKGDAGSKDSAKS